MPTLRLKTTFSHLPSISTGSCRWVGTTRLLLIPPCGMRPSRSSARRRVWARSYARAPAEYEHAWMHTDVAIIGGGWAGIHAALAIVERGDSIVLVDDQTALGGQLRYRKNADAVPADAIERLRSAANVAILQDSFCFGMYEGNLLGILQRNPHSDATERLVHLRAKRVVVATGTFETPFLFPNNDLPGVMLSTGVRRLLHLYGVVPGGRAVVLGSGVVAEEIAAELRAAGTEIAAVVDRKR